MGWLRNFMQGANPSIPSFGRLAERALEHSAWPEDTQPKTRSLATLFSKLDRGEQLDWLRDRLVVQQVLAELLGRPLGDLRQAIGELAFESDEKFLRLYDVRYAREIDLSREPLPPGIPGLALDPPSWERSWWIAGPGAGKSIVGKWLKCRGLAHVATVRSRVELGRLPSRGPLFIELSPQFAEMEPALGPADLNALRGEHRPILFAHPFPPSEDLPVECLRSPNVEDYLPELVDWVASRLDGRGHFGADRAEQWMRRVALRSGSVRSLGDALGLLGMLDEVPTRSLLAKSLDEVGQHFVARRVREASEQTSTSPRLAEQAYPALLDAAGRCLVEPSYSIDRAYSIDIWTTIFSQDERDEAPDPQWFTDALSGALGHQISKRDLRRAAQKVHPSAFALVQSLSAAQLLTRVSSGSDRAEDASLRKLHPHWLTSLLQARASTRVITYSSLEWGRVLILGAEADRLIQALFDQLKKGDLSPIFSAVEDFDVQRMETIAALEGATIALGLVALEELEVPDELIAQVLDCCAESSMFLSDELLSRTTYSEARSELFTDAAFSAAIAVLCRHKPFPLQHFDPYRSGRSSVAAHFISKCTKLVQTKKRANNPLVPRLSHTQQAGMWITIFELGADPNSGAAEIGKRGLQTAKSDWSGVNVTSTDEFQALAPPLRVALSFGNRADLSQALEYCPIEVLIRLGEHFGLHKSSILLKIWELMAEEDTSQFTFDPATESELWSALSIAMLQSRLAKGLLIKWELVRPHQYAQWLKSENLSDFPPGAALNCPMDAAEAALNRLGPLAFAPNTLRVFLERAPTRLSPLSNEWIKSPPKLSYALENCPPNASAVICASLPDAEQLIKHPPSVVDAVRRFMQRAITERHPSFEQCYNRLAAIERALWPLRKVP